MKLRLTIASNCAFAVACAIGSGICVSAGHPVCAAALAFFAGVCASVAITLFAVSRALRPGKRGAV